MLSTLFVNIPDLSKVKHIGYWVLVGIFGISGVISCGKRKPPVAPHERVAQRAELIGYQRGTQIILTWQMPARNAPVGSVLNISRVDVYRLAEPLSSPQQMSEEEFANRGTLIAALAVTDADFTKKVLSYRDTLEFTGQAARLRYAVRFVNSAGQKAAFSNSLLIEPVARVATNPTGLSAVPSQDAIRLSWNAPTRNVDGSAPANILGYNVYRSKSQVEPAQLINSSPLTTTSFDDTGFQFGERYYYFVRTVSMGLNAAPIESSESNVANLLPRDVFMPSAPSSLTIAASSQAISIFFAINPEKDIDGYRIYRSTDPRLERKDWTLLTPQLLKSNTYQDTRVESGKTYYYYVIAVDLAGNVSESSETISDTIP